MPPCMLHVINKDKNMDKTTMVNMDITWHCNAIAGQFSTLTQNNSTKTINTKDYY